MLSALRLAEQVVNAGHRIEPVLRLLEQCLDRAVGCRRPWMASSDAATARLFLAR